MISSYIDIVAHREPLNELFPYQAWNERVRSTCVERKGGNFSSPIKSLQLLPGSSSHDGDCQFMDHWDE